MWHELLGIDGVDVRDDFFERGGHSLLATQLTASLRDFFSVDVTLENLFEASTVEQLSNYVMEQLLDQENQDAESLLAEVERVNPDRI